MLKQFRGNIFLNSRFARCNLNTLNTFKAQMKTIFTKLDRKCKNIKKFNIKSKIY